MFRTDKLSPKGGTEAVYGYSEVKFVRSKGNKFEIRLANFYNKQEKQLCFNFY